MKARFLAIASDPHLIPGVHHYCDEWCTYCEVTNRCLAFRCAEDWRKHKNRSIDEPAFATREESIAFTRTLAAVEGRTTEELDALVSSPPGESGIRTSDPLADIAWSYAAGTAMLLAQVARNPPYDAVAGDPSPMDVVAWFHLRVYMKIFRALVARERIETGSRDKQEEAIGCAKLALVAIQRSRQALPMLMTERSARRVARLDALLGALDEGIDARFPAARGFLRVGIDVPAAA